MGRTGRESRGSTPATVALNALGVTYTVHSYPHDPSADSYGLEAAEALGLDPGRVLKTLVTDVDGELVVAVVPVRGRLDLKALASAAGGKRAVMADPAVAARATGYVLGGISPIGQRRLHRTVVDASAMGWPTVHVSGGKRGFEIELSPADLVEVTRAITAAVAH